MKRSFEGEQPEDPLRSIEQTIFNMGDPHPTLSVAEDVQQTTTMILDEVSRYGDTLLEALVACLLELPHKTPLYVKLIGLINKQEHALGAQLCTLLVKRVSMAAKEAGPWRHLQQGLVAISLLAVDGLFNETEVKDLLSAVSTSGDYGQSLVENAQGWLNPKNLSFKWQRDYDSIEITTSTAHPLGSVESLVRDPQWEPAVPLLCDVELFQCDKASADLIILNLRQLIETFDLNPRRLVEMLFAACDEDLCQPERLIWELLLTEMLRSRRLRGQSALNLRQVCYEVIAMNCCRYKSRSFPPAMAKRLNALLLSDAEIVSVGPVGLTRLAEWFAHHLSNFDFKWRWDDWQPWLEAGEAGMDAALLRKLFVTLLIDRLARLSYGERLREVLPGWLHAVLPDSNPDPMPEKGNHEQFPRLVELIGQRASVSEVSPLLSDLDPAVFIEALVVVAAGAKALSHCQILLEQYLPCLQTLNPREREDNRMVTMEAVAQVWQRSAWHRDWLIGRLLHYRVLNAPIAIRWLLARLPTLSLLEQLQSWRLLANILEQSRLVPITLQHRLERTEEGPAREKLAITKDNMVKEYQVTVTEALNGLVGPYAEAFITAIRQDHPEMVSFN